MSVIGKVFNCGNCGTAVTLKSEGTSFICPNCKTNNALPVTVAQTPAQSNVAMIRLIIAIALVLFGLYIFFSV